MRYLHRIDPNITAEQGRRILASAEAETAKMRPKAAAANQAKIEAIKADIQELERT